MLNPEHSHIYSVVFITPLGKLMLGNIIVRKQFPRKDIIPKASASYKSDKCKSRRALLTWCSKSVTKGMALVLVFLQRLHFNSGQQTGREQEEQNWRVGLSSETLHTNIIWRTLTQLVTHHSIKNTHRSRIKRLKSVVWLCCCVTSVNYLTSGPISPLNSLYC